MHGLVREPCWDRYHSDFYLSPEAAKDPIGPSEGDYRIFRGGGRYDDFVDCDVANRMYADPKTRNTDNGLRVVRTAFEMSGEGMTERVEQHG